MSFDFSKLTDFAYLTDPRPPYQFALFWPAVTIFAGLVVIAFSLPFLPLSYWQRKFVSHLVAPLWTLGLGGLVLLFFRNQSLPYLSSRIFLLLFILALVAWIGYSLTVARRKTLAERLENERASRLQKYLPKGKN